MDKKTILFVCTHNSARSQMAEGLVNHHFSDTWQAYSAGTEETRVNPFATQAMSKAGIDITTHSSKTTQVFVNQSFDVVVTVCDSAKEVCPYFPTTGKLVHRSFPDPSRTEGTDEDKLNAFCDVREQLLQWLRTNIDTL